jgi:hypothetical protein
MGGTFACLKGSNHALWCQGDDVFGQRARAVAPVDEIALGTWHGCARSDGGVRCWGRGDGGQLGVRAPDRCLTQSGDEVACARTPRPVPALSVSGPITLGAGDLFTCLGDGAGIRCWGAARDGFFGKPAACDARLVTAWPTRQGPVAAPRAACAAVPEHIAGTERLAGKTPPDFDVGPRGLCVLRDGRVECRGAIPSPRAAGLAQLKVSPGSDAAACAMAGGDVVCWGEGYSPPAAPGAPVEVARVAIQKRIPDSIVCKIDNEHATVEGPEIEVYVLLAMNKHLRHFPDFAATVADKPIRDCATARAYVKAHAVYLAAHPDFDVHEPHDADDE